MRNSQITITAMQLVDVNNIVVNAIQKYEGLLTTDSISICVTEAGTIEVFAESLGCIGSVHPANQTAQQ